MRFRTTQRSEFNNEKIRFGCAANPKTVFEQMARQSRMKPNLVNLDKNGAKTKSSLQEAGRD